MPTPSLSPNSCPLRNVCEITTAGGPQCGTLPEHVPALPAAADLCLRALETAIDVADTAEDPPYILEQREQDIALAGLLMDAAQLKDTRRANELLAEAQEILDDVAADPKQRFATLARGRLLAIHLPAFKAQVRGQRPTAVEMKKMGSEMGRLMNDAMGASMHSHEDESTLDAGHTPCFTGVDAQKGTLIKLGFHALALRSGLVLLPATDREARSPDREKRHDGGFIVDGYKIPVLSRSKPNRGTKDLVGSDPNIMRLAWNKYVGEASNLNGGRKRITVDNIHDLALYWLARDMSGHTLSQPQQKTILDLMGQRLKLDIKDYMTDVREYGA